MTCALGVAAVGCSDSSSSDDEASGTGGDTETSQTDSTTSDGGTTDGTSSAGTDPTDSTTMTTDGTTTDDPTEGAGDWWDCAWSNRTRLVVLGPAGTEALENFVVPIYPESPWFDFGAAADAAADLRFIDPEGSELAYEVESWSEDPGYVVWVRIPSIPPQGQGVTVDLYYGNSIAEAGEARAETWSAYSRVWHLSGARQDAVVDSPLQGQATTVAGIVGNAESFTVADDLLAETPAGIDANLFANGATLSAWVNASSYGGGGFGRVLEVASGLGGSGGFTWFADDTVDGFGFSRGHDGAPGYWTFAGAIALDSWTHVALSYDDVDSAVAPRGYSNGTEIIATEEDAPGGAVETSATEALTIGEVSFAGQSRQFAGAIDELRVRSEVSTARWVAAEHASVQGNMVAALEQATVPPQCP